MQLSNIKTQFPESDYAVSKLIHYYLWLNADILERKSCKRPAASARGFD